MATLTAVEPTADTFTIAVVDDDPKLRTRLALQLGEVARANPYPTLEVFEHKAEPGGPTVLVLGPTYADDEGLAQAARLIRAHPEVSAVMVVEELSTAVLQQAIRAGVSDVIALPADHGQLAEAVERAAENLAILPSPPGGAVATEAGQEPGRIITVFSTKGGAGKSVVALNLAIALAKKSDRPVAVVDADLQFGDVAVMLKLTPQHTIVDAVSAIQRLDAQLLRSLLIRHERSGILVLPAPTEPAFADQVSPASMLRILEILQSFCGHIVVDTPAHFTDVVLSLLEHSDDIVLVAGMDIPNIKNVKIGLQTLRLLDVPFSKLKLVLNRANTKVKLDVGEVERTLQLKADCLVPSDIIVPQSVNKGIPAVLDAPKSGVSKSLEQLADLFINAGARRRHR